MLSANTRRAAMLERSNFFELAVQVARFVPPRGVEQRLGDELDGVRGLGFRGAEQAEQHLHDARSRYSRAR